MSAQTANKLWTLRGAAGAPPAQVKLRDVAGVGQVAWRHWGHHLPHMPLRDLLSLVYAEGIAHGVALAERLSRSKP